MKNLEGKKFGKLTVLRKDENRKYHYICKCDCGNEKSIRSDNLINRDNTRSCGCLISKSDLTGKKFGRLTVLKLDIYRKYHYICKCDCGNEKSVRHNNLVSGSTKSCGCLRLGSKYNKQAKNIPTYSKRDIPQSSIKEILLATIKELDSKDNEIKSQKEEIFKNKSKINKQERHLEILNSSVNSLESQRKDLFEKLNDLDSSVLEKQTKISELNNKIENLNMSFNKTLSYLIYTLLKTSKDLSINEFAKKMSFDKDKLYEFMIKNKYIYKNPNGEGYIANPDLESKELLKTMNANLFNSFRFDNKYVKILNNGQIDLAKSFILESIIIPNENKFLSLQERIDASLDDFCL